MAVGQTWQGQFNQRMSPRGVTAEDSKTLLKTVKLYPEVNMKNQRSNIVSIDINAVKSRMLEVGGSRHEIVKEAK